MFVIDVSKHQESIDFTTTKKSGVDGVILRCAYANKTDVKFERYYTDAIKVGIPVGVYQYATWHYSGNATTKSAALDIAKSQANNVVALLKGKTISGPVALDLELEQGCSTVLSKSDMTEVANAYMDIIANAGYSAVLYCSISWLYDKMIPANVKYPLWIAYYHASGATSDAFPATAYGNQMTKLKSKIWLWQYSSSGKASTYGASSSYVDLNHCYKRFSTSATTSGSQVANSSNSTSQTATATPSASSSTKYTTYTVKKGDTLSSIASQHNTTYQKLALYNGIANPNVISIGQIIKIPATTATSTSSTNLYAKGRAISLKNANLYANSTAVKATKQVTGTYYIYDGYSINNRYRITNAKSYVGKTPLGSYVTGYVHKTSIK